MLLLFVLWLTLLIDVNISHSGLRLKLRILWLRYNSTFLHLVCSYLFLGDLYIIIYHSDGIISFVIMCYLKKYFWYACIRNDNKGLPTTKGTLLQHVYEVYTNIVMCIFNNGRRKWMYMNNIWVNLFSFTVSLKIEFVYCLLIDITIIFILI